MRRFFTFLLGGFLFLGGLQARKDVGVELVYGIDRIVDVATEKYVQSGRTPEEQHTFKQAIGFFKNSSLSVFGLLGMRHFVKPTPTGKAYSAALRKRLENKAVVRDGMVYVGKKNVGRIEDMPTIRTFTKPTDPVLREEFQSDVFTKEVMYQGPGTGYNYRVYQRNDIDWNLIRTKGEERLIGKTNLEAALKGYAPELNDGSIVNLHHVGQSGFGPLAETSTRIHSAGNPKTFRPLHNQFRGRSNPNSKVVHDSSWNIDRSIYWKERAQHVTRK